MGEGDEPSPFFFQLVTAKCLRENLSEILLEDGTLLVTENGILKEIHTFYANLYCSSGQSSEVTQSKAHIFRNTRNKVTDTQNRRLNQLPTLVEVKGVIDSLTKNKSPGIDGLTVKVYRNCWEFIASGLLEFIHDFWQSSSLPDKVKEGIIQLVPKNPDKQRLADWRPLTMLNTLYKILTQLLANRLKLLLSTLISHNKLVSSQDKTSSTTSLWHG